MIQLKIISKAAQKEKNISPVKVGDREDIAYLVEQYMKEVADTEKARYGLTTKMLTDVLTENVLARRVYDFVTGKVDGNLTREQMRTAKVQMIHLMSEGTDKNGKEIVLDAAGKTALYERAVSLQQQAKKNGNFYSLAEQNSSRKEIDYLLGMEASPTDVVKVAFLLKPGQVSEVISANDGFYIIKCISIDEAGAVKQHRDEVILSRETKTFQAWYENQAECYEVKVSKSLLGQELK